MSSITALRKPIPEIIKRHAGDAAFYWNQWDKAKNSFVIDAEQLTHIENLLIAHLDGLLEAKELGWQEALASMQRWKSPGETFVCCVLALTHNSQERFEILWPLLEKNIAYCTRGFISALAWYSQRTEAAAPWLTHWLQTAESPLIKTVALRASHCLGSIPIDYAITASQHNDTHVRAAGCRTLAPHIGNPLAGNALISLLNDTNIQVRAEAAIALLKNSNDQSIFISALSCLWKSIAEKLPTLDNLIGSKKRSALRQLKRWLFYWATHTPLNQPEFANALEHLPNFLQIEAIGLLGNMAHIPLLMKHMDQLELAPAALTTLELLTGCDATHLQLTRPIDQEQLAAIDALPQEYLGLPFPHKPALEHWWQHHHTHFSTTTKVFQGHALEKNQSTTEFLQQLIHTAPQRIARIATHHTVTLAKAV